MIKRVGLTLTAMGLALSATTAYAADVKVGAAGGFTGPVAEIAATIEKARDLAAKDVNASGGLFKGGDKLRLVTADTACDPKAAVDGGNKLVNVEQVASIVGPTCSGAVIAMAQSVTIPAGVMVIADSATSPAITTLKDNDTVFRTVASDTDQGSALAKMVKDAGISQVAMIVTNDDYDVGIADVFAKAFAALGGKISAKQTVEGKQESYRSDLATLSKGGDQTLMVFAYYGSGGITIIKNSLEQGLFSRFYGSGGMADQSVIDQIGADNLKGNLFIATPAADTNDPSYQAYAKEAVAAGLEPSAPYAANGYDAMFLTALAIEKAGSADRKGLPAALRQVTGPGGEVVRPGEWAKAKALIAQGKKVDYVGASGKLEFDAAGDVSGTFGVNTVGADGKLEKTLVK